MISVYITVQSSTMVTRKRQLFICIKYIMQINTSSTVENSLILLFSADSTVDKL